MPKTFFLRILTSLTFKSPYPNVLILYLFIYLYMSGVCIGVACWFDLNFIAGVSDRGVCRPVAQSPITS